MAAGVLTGDPVPGLKALNGEDGSQQELEGLSDREIPPKLIEGNADHHSIGFPGLVVTPAAPHGDKENGGNCNAA
jgi:hypothetical protein